MLRNTAFIYGVLVYAGQDTKIIRNLRNSRLKFSSQEKKLNRIVGGVFAANLLVVLLNVLLAGLWQAWTGRDSWYLMWDESGLYVRTFVLRASSVCPLIDVVLGGRNTGDNPVYCIFIYDSDIVIRDD